MLPGTEAHHHLHGEVVSYGILAVSYKHLDVYKRQARMKERQFAAYINQKNSVELRREMNVLQKELDAMKKRSGELSALFKRLYEDNVLGRVTNEQFRMLSSDYNVEQKHLEDTIPHKEMLSLIHI